MSLIINPNAPPAQPQEKRVTIKTRAGEMVSADLTLQDDKGRQSAAEYIHHLFQSIREKLGEVVITQVTETADPDDMAENKRRIIYIAAFHDSMFGTFNHVTKLPEEERNEFVEIFLLAVATLMPGRNILVDLGKGSISDGAGLN